MGAIGDGTSNTVTFTVTPPAGAAAVNAIYKIAARYTTAGKTGYTDEIVRLVSPVEGRFQRCGKWAEYDNWIEQHRAARRCASAAPAALADDRHGRDDRRSRSRSTTGPTTPQSGTVSLTLPSNVTADATSQPYAAARPRRRDDGQLQRLELVHQRDAADDDPGNPPVAQNMNVASASPRPTPAGRASRPSRWRSCPRRRSTRRRRRRRSTASTAPGEYAGNLLDIGRIWEGGGNCPAAGFGVDCGTSGAVGDPTSTYGRAAYRDDALFFFIRVRTTSSATRSSREECVAHWLADSVEIIIDPRGRASENAMDTANTFKLADLPVHQRPDELQRQRRQRPVLVA